MKNVSGGVSARVNTARAAPPAAGGGATTVHAIKATNLQKLDIDGVIKLFHSQFGLTKYDEIIKENDISGPMLIDLIAEDLIEI